VWEEEKGTAIVGEPAQSTAQDQRLFQQREIQGKERVGGCPPPQGDFKGVVSPTGQMK